MKPINTPTRRASVSAEAQSDSRLATQLRSAAPNVARAATLALVFAFNVVVARSMGPEGAGHFLTAIVIVTLVGMLGRIGSDTFVLKYGSALHRQGALTPSSLDWAWIRGITAAVGTALGVLTFVVSTLIHASAHDGLTQALALLALSVPFQSISILNSALLRAVGRAALGAFAEMGLIQGLAMAGLVLLSFAGRVGPIAAGAVFGASSALTAGWSVWAVRRLWSAERPNGTTMPLQRAAAIREMSQMMGSSVLFYGLTWLPIFALWVQSTPTQAAFYMAAVRYPSMLSIIPTIQMTAVVPQLAGLFRTGRLAEVNNRLRQVNRESALVALPAGLLMVLAAGPLVALFGPGFAPAQTTLRVLALGQVLVVLFGFVNSVMLFAGLERAAVHLAAAALFVGVPISLVGAAVGGAFGAAIAFSAIMLGYNGLAAILIQRREGVITYFWPTRRGATLNTDEAAAPRIDAAECGISAPVFEAGGATQTSVGTPPAFAAPGLPDDLESVAAVVVAFHPEQTLFELCKGLKAQGCHVVIMDNSDAPGSVVLQCVAIGAEVHSLGANIGLAGALAAGLDALSEAVKWVFTFDQDSVIPNGYVADLLGSGAVSSPEVALVGPVARDRRSQDLIQGDPAQRAWYPVPRLITSGALCRVSALRAVGGFRRELFIDYLDFDVCARLRRRGYVVAVEPTVELLHSIGELTRHELVGGLAVGTTNHSGDRLYYKFRNFIILMRDGTFRYEDFTWKARSSVALALTPFKIVIFEADRGAKLLGVWRGVVDGLRSRTGPRPAARH